MNRFDIATGKTESPRFPGTIPAGETVHIKDSSNGNALLASAFAEASGLPPCIGNVARHVNHADLKREGDSAYKSTCPMCEEGMLLVYRNPATLVLEEHDRCIHCGQAFIYDDIDIMRSREGRVLPRPEERPLAGLFEGSIVY